MDEFSIIFKFRDEIRINKEDVNQYGISIPENYLEESEKWTNAIFKYIESHQENPSSKAIDSRNIFNFSFKNLDSERVGTIILALQTQLDEFKELLNSITLDKRYLFEYLPIDSFNKFNSLNGLRKLPQYFQQINVDNDIPNFYNYFIIRFDQTQISKEAFLNLINKFSSFLPHKNDYCYHLLDFAYLKQSPIESGNGNISGDRNNDYIRDMGIILNWKGENVNISIVEFNKWNLEHPEFAGTTNVPNVIFPKTPFLPNLPSGHGNSILGIFKAKNDVGNDCIGISPAAKFRLSSCNTYKGDANIEMVIAEENAIWAAISHSKASDIILLEIQNVDNSPMEFQPAIYQLLYFATQKEIIVVEPAGNGSGNIDDLTKWGNLKAILKQSERQIWDNSTQFLEHTGQAPFLEKKNFLKYLKYGETGAILVGAYAKNNDDIPKKIKKEFSNWGKRVQIYGQGEKVLVADGENSYTSSGDTSAAAAIIAGAIASLQGQLKSKMFYANSKTFISLFKNSSTPDVHFNNTDGSFRIDSNVVVPNYSNTALKISIATTPIPSGGPNPPSPFNPD